MNKGFLFLVLFVISCGSSGGSSDPVVSEDPRKRVLVTTDLGGDPDDTQSLVHLLLYSDILNLEGIVVGWPTGNFGLGLATIAEYEKDLPNLSFHSGDYPTPDYLRSILKQGSTRKFNGTNASEGSTHIIAQALKPSNKKLHISVWGSITDVAQAIHDAPEIKQFITVTSSGGWNTRQDEESRAYLFNNHPDLVWVEQDSTGRGIYVTGLNDKSRYGNVGFVSQIVRPAGNLGEFYYQQSRRINVNAFGIKMGDTPTWFIPVYSNVYENLPVVAQSEPTAPSWGGRYCQPVPNRATYWNDCPHKEWIIGGYKGTYTVAEHRQAILNDWELRLLRTYPPEVAKAKLMQYIFSHAMEIRSFKPFKPFKPVELKRK